MTTEFKIRNEIRSLTAFRFIAAFYVFLFHLQGRVDIFGHGAFGSLISQGAVGMTMFFVLSGFVLSHAYDSVTFDIRKYALNRIARIYPIYLLAAILALPWLWRDIFVEAQKQNLLYTSIETLIILFTGITLTQSWIPQTFALWNNGASWSISNEAFFYSIFPILKGIFSKLSRGYLIGSFVALCLFSSLIPASDIVFSNKIHSFSLFYALPLYRLPEFICGIITYHLCKRAVISNMTRMLLLVVIFAGIAHVTVFGMFFSNNFTLNNYIFIPAVSAAIVILYDAELRGVAYMGGAVFVWLGRISYCFYSFQFHVLEGLKWVLKPGNNPTGEIRYALIATLLLLILAAIAHHFVEEPVRIWLRGWAKNAQRELVPEG